MKMRSRCLWYQRSLEMLGTFAWFVSPGRVYMKFVVLPLVMCYLCKVSHYEANSIGGRLKSLLLKGAGGSVYFPCPFLTLVVHS